MKIGIITITNGQNYGNRLQNYALQEILKKLDHEPETIWNDTGAWENLGVYSRLKYWVKSKLHIKYTPKVDRVIKFTAFNRKNIVWSKYSVSASNVPKNLSQEYDYFISGSDQVWNMYYERTSGVDFLSFAEREQKIAYAASMGVDKIEPEHEKLFKEYLDDFPRISVRERQGADILQNILNREIPVMPDPTVLLQKEEWDKLKKKPEKVSEGEKYVLTYFLGENKCGIEFAEKISRKFGCKLISLEDCYTDGWENPYFISIDPGEFLWLIEHAERILTDSFHGCVFSVLYHKHFLVYPRNFKVRLGSRIQQLLHSYHLEDHMVGDDYETNLQVLDKAVCADDVLERERNRGINFLQRSLLIEKKD